jgi:hypothetical protein
MSMWRLQSPKGLVQLVFLSLRFDKRIFYHGYTALTPLGRLVGLPPLRAFSYASAIKD